MNRIKNKVESIQFKQLVEEDLELMYSWFKEPIINQMYARGQSWSLDDIRQKYLPRILGYEKVPSFIILEEGQPIGFIQYYCFVDFLAEGIIDNDNSLFDKYSSKNTAGIDLFIADSLNRGIGLGSNIINRFIATYLQKFQCIVVDPDKNNLKAIRCYEKSGFVKSTFSKHPTYILMIKELSR